MVKLPPSDVMMVGVAASHVSAVALLVNVAAPFVASTFNWRSTLLLKWKIVVPRRTMMFALLWPPAVPTLPVHVHDAEPVVALIAPTLAVQVCGAPPEIGVAVKTTFAVVMSPAETLTYALELTAAVLLVLDAVV